MLDRCKRDWHRVLGGELDQVQEVLGFIAPCGTTFYFFLFVTYVAVLVGESNSFQIIQ